jgi:hypothetical protein
LQSFRAAGLGYLDGFHEGWIAEGVWGAGEFQVSGKVSLLAG